MSNDLFLAGWLLVTALLSAMTGILALAVVQARGERPTSGIFADSGDATDFLFDGETLVDATPAARALLPHSPMRVGSAWSRLKAWLAPRFPELDGALARLATEGRVTLASDDSTGLALLLKAELRGGLTRLSLVDADPDAAAMHGTALADHAAREELLLLRRTAADAPVPIWQETAAEGVIWANRAYLDLALQSLAPGKDLSWPLPRVFDAPAGDWRSEDRQRMRLALPGMTEPRWYDLVAQTDTRGARLLYALPCDRTVLAEAALQGFMQTLAKTFAHLPVGLAIFDQTRRLVLFNPALVDLIALPPDFLAARPVLAAVFDAMRDRAMLPEPRDYHDWRDRIIDIERAAASGGYEETWSLAGGQTYRVTARPHPNGALALMFEDISDEMSQTRRYRADLELGQAVIDAMDEAIAVFSSAGILVMSNTAYAALWGHDPAATLDGATNMGTLCDHWRHASGPSLLWDRVEDFAGAIGAAASWTDDIILLDGRRVTCRFARLSGGATLAGFRPTAEQAATLAPVAAVRRRRA